MRLPLPHLNAVGAKQCGRRGLYKAATQTYCVLKLLGEFQHLNWPDGDHILLCHFERQLGWREKRTINMFFFGHASVMVLISISK